jgi:leucyl/phenylalanyl-tRNA---protein transferase
VLWWAPDPREVLAPAEFKCSRSLAKTLRNRGFEVSFDRAFGEVVIACAARREHSTGTWITSEMQTAYCELHARGHAHSVEVRLGEDLVGGLYGVLMGRVFFGESMFSRERDASKVALARLAERAVVAGLQLIDCQLPTPHLRSLGSRPMGRQEFSALVAEATTGPDVPLFGSA